MKRRKIIIGTSLTLVALLAVLLGASQYMLNYSLKAKGHDLEFGYQKIFSQHPYTKPWIDSLQQAKALKDTFIVSSDGVKLHAYYVAAATLTPKTAVLVHGYQGNSVTMLKLGYLYNKVLNFNILLPDLRYSELSGGKAIQMGWLDRLDVIRWMEIANQRFGGNTQMVVHGISMGAATTMMVSGEPQPEYVKCFVEDCGYTSVWDQFAKELKAQFNIPRFPLMYTASWLCQLEYGWGFKEASALKQVAKCHLPMFFIHGDKDDYVPTWMVYQLYDAKPAPKELWIVPGADHDGCYRYNAEEYTEKVKQFVDKYIQ